MMTRLIVVIVVFIGIQMLPQPVDLILALMCLLAVVPTWVHVFLDRRKRRTAQ